MDDSNAAPVAALAGPTLSVAEAADYLGVSRALIYAACRDYRQTEGRTGVPHVVIGRRVLVLTDELEGMLHPSSPSGEVGSERTRSAGAIPSRRTIRTIRVGSSSGDSLSPHPISRRRLRARPRRAGRIA